MIRRHLKTALLSLLATTAQANETTPVATELDTVFLNALVVDGGGKPAYRADVGLRDGRIAEIGELADIAAKDRVQLDGLALAPGFIDVHSHADRDAIDAGRRLLKGLVTQGITTVVLGVDGEASLSDLKRNRATFETQGIGTNFMYYIGHNGIRTAVMGDGPGTPTRDQLARMTAMVREAMDIGAVGLSTGLMYLPGNHAETHEVAALAAETAAWGGRYDSHVRDPARNLLESIEECLDIARRAGVMAHPAHLKAVGGANFGKAPEIVATVEAAIAAGLDVTSDVYPYDGAAVRPLEALLLVPPGLTLPDALLDPLAREQIRAASERPPADAFSWIKAVGYSSMRIVVSGVPGYEGQMLTDVAKLEGKSAFDVIADLIVRERGHARVTLGAIREADVRTLIAQPWVMISSDGRDGGFAEGVGHPRYRGTFPRVLGRYVREWRVLTLEEAVRKMTALPAAYLGLPDRGSIRKGAIADIAIFDPDTVIDRSTWAEPSLYSTGVAHVLIGGRFAMRDGRLTGEAHGRFLPFRGTRPADERSQFSSDDN